MLEYLEIKGYKSIRELKIELRPINILIGSNGAGKSNFISFFKLLRAIFNQRLQRFVLEEGKADNLLYFGRKTTDELKASIYLRKHKEIVGYGFSLIPSNSGTLFFSQEGVGKNLSRFEIGDTESHFGAYGEESTIGISNSAVVGLMIEQINSLHVFHFHDTTATSKIRSTCEINDNRYLKHDGSNLAAMLYYLKVKHPIVFIRIEKTVRRVAPFFNEFILEPDRLHERLIELRWNETDDPDSNFGASQFSDGTIRFIALATLLMQPEPPAVTIIDEPELGLHPMAINLLAGMIQSATPKTQLIISTQSASLVDQFEPEDIITVDRSRTEKQSVFHRLDKDQLSRWLSDHTLGDLWERNIFNAAQPFKI